MCYESFTNLSDVKYVFPYDQGSTEDCVVRPLAAATTFAILSPGLDVTVVCCGSDDGRRRSRAQPWVVGSPHLANFIVSNAGFKVQLITFQPRPKDPQVSTARQIWYCLTQNPLSFAALSENFVNNINLPTRHHWG